MRNLSKLSISFEDQLLSQDRLIMFALILGLTAIFCASIEYRKINLEYERKMEQIHIQYGDLSEALQKKKNLSMHSGFKHEY